MTVEQNFEALDQFPIGMRVLAVDDDQTCLRILESLLRHCQYNVTTTNQAQKALELLRENKNKFDLVISDVDMPDMDGFKLLELVGLEMDLPVIMLSAHSDPKYVMKGVTHGACDYLLKPVRIEELKNIWQHVVRKNRGSNNGEKRDGSGNEGVGNSDQNSGRANRKRKDQYNEDEDEERDDNDDSSAAKKQRVVWTVELHKKFVAAVNQLGYEKAMPKKILDLMNVEKLTRENVASHLQKFRLYLKRISGVTNQQAIMANSDLHFLQMSSSLNGLDSFHHRPIPVGPGQFHGGAPPMRPFPSNGILGRLNTPSGIGVRNLSSPPAGMFLQNQTDLGKFHHVSSSLPLNHSDGGNILQGLPMPLEFDQLQANNNNNNNNNNNIRNMNNNKSIAGSSMAFPSFSTHQNSLIRAPNNNLVVLDGHPQASPPGFPGHQNNKRLEHWSNAVSSSTLPPPQTSNSIHHQFDVSPLPHSRPDPLEWNNVSSSYSIPFCDSASTMSPQALDTPNPGAFSRNTDFNSNANANAQPGGFYDSLQMRQSGNYGPTTDAMLSTNPKEGFVVGQQKLQSGGFMSADAGSLDDIVNSTMKQEQSQGELSGGDLGYGGFSSLRTCI
ncbi:hypothetical protein CARUB_v10022837mg [Capsella rubella]|uniref:Two-component response regulator n=1 Tax=Capsella rubella TaxID=81985 RepID=R0FVX1_9BRAS|nr:two-component response regulator ARR12 [Capsella rubella]EOA26751.1 hypothetical protein CARUB_v10022837mg [Capsella rubella]